MSSSESENESNSTTDSVSSSEEDDDSLPDGINEKDFLKTLSCLKNKDPQIYVKEVEFFNQEEKKVNKGRSKTKESNENLLYIKDYERKILSNDENKVVNKPDLLTYNEEQRALKESFKDIVNESSDDDDSDNLLRRKVKDVKEEQEEEEDYIQWLKGKKEKLEDKEVEKDLKPLYDYWNNPTLDKKEEFLKDYILNKRYLEKDSEGNYDDSELSEDGIILEEQADFEQNYNFRFEGEGDKNVKRFPRNIEGSLRRKNDSRKTKREEIVERKKKEKEKKKLEIKKKQKEKLCEIKEKIDKLKEITCNAELGFKDDEILEDFDPEKYDKKMEQLYDDNFYSVKVGDKPNFNSINDDDGNWNIDDINMDCDADESAAHKETRSKKKRKNKKSKAYTDVCDIVQPVFDPEKHNSYQKYIDQYYNLDCEDFIEDIPCRFKYREVVPNDYGLSVEEILMADDKELNRWASAKKMCILRPKQVEKNEVKIYKQKAQDESLKIKLLPSLYKNEEEENEGKEENLSEEEVESEVLRVEEQAGNNSSDNKKEIQTNQVSRKRKKRKKKKLAPSPEENVQSTSGVLGGGKTKAKKNKYKKPRLNGNGSKNILDKISDNRLLAYDIKPRKFRSKLKHFKDK